MGAKKLRINVCCGTCINNEDGFCDFMGVYVEDTDKPHCERAKGWEVTETAKRNWNASNV